MCTLSDVYKVLQGWNIAEKQFISFINEIPNISNCTKLSELSEFDWAKIKTYCNIAIENTILNNKIIQDMIFIGKGLFEDPYYAPFIFSNGTLKENIIPSNFTITTGSGRHKGIYTIIVKPSTSVREKKPLVYNQLEDYPHSMVAENMDIDYNVKKN